MKMINKLTCATGLLSVAALTMISAPALMAQTIIIHPPMPPPPPVVVVPPPPPRVIVVPPPPVVTVDVVPDYYVWDGDEYVGVVGDQYVCLGPGDVWLPMPRERIVFFHDWESHHHDWREHAIENERYRSDSHGKVHPWKEHHQDHDSGHHDRDRDHGR